MKQVETKQDLDKHLKVNTKTLAIFYSTWCPFCNRFLPAFNKHISTKKFENILHVILDDDDNPLWDVYGISAVPTIIYFEGTEVLKRLDARLGSGLNESQLQKWLEQF
jgi:thioredoxin 1